ncbi:MAG: SCP2 sterol-binding domain-containing protein [Mycobacteriaceae bacterium]
MPDINDIDPKKISVHEYIATLEEMFASGLDPGEVDPGVFARLVKNSSGKQLGELDTNERAQLVIAAVFSQMSEHFRPDEMRSPKESTIRWVLTGAEDFVYETTVSTEGCTVSEGAHADAPRVTLTMKPSQFIKLASGNASPTMMYMTRKLKLSGNLGFAAALGSMFHIPKA